MPTKAGYSQPEADRPGDVHAIQSVLHAEVVRTAEPVRHPENSEILAFGCYRIRKAPACQ